MVDIMASPGEDLSFEQADVGGLPGEFYISDTEQSVLIWMDEETGIWYKLDAKLDPSIILHIAESVSLVDPTK